MLHTRGWRIALGTLPEWFAAFGTLVAIGAVLVAALGYRHQVHSHTEDEQQLRQAERRQQAETITAWMGGQTAVYREVIRGQGPVMACTVQVNILNASPSVVYDVVVAVICKHSERPTLVNTAEGIAQSHTAWNPQRDRLALGRAEAVPPGPWRVRVKLAHESVIAEHVHLFFRDHRGVTGTPSATRRQASPVISGDELLLLGRVFALPCWLVRRVQS
jgi:hypothetical protein